MSKASGIIEKLKKVSKSEYSEVVSHGIVSDTVGYIDTGCYLLNAQLSGDFYKGLAGNKTTMFAGESTTGKTFFALSLVRNFLKQDEENNVIYFDSESAVDSSKFEVQGIDVERVLYVPVSTIEEVEGNIVEYSKVIKESGKKGKFLFVLDSLGQISTQHEQVKAMEGKRGFDQGLIAKCIKASFRIINPLLSDMQCSFIVTNHIFADPSNPYVIKIAGGKNPRYISQTIITLTKKLEKDSAKKVKNVILTASAYKNRDAKENTKIEIILNYAKGLHRYSGLPELAIEQGLWKQKGAYIVLEDDSKKYKSEILKHPKKYFTEDVMNKLNSYAKEIFSYGEFMGEDDNDIFEDNAEVEDE